MPGQVLPLPTVSAPLRSAHGPIGGRALIQVLQNAGIVFGDGIQKVVIEADCRDAVRIYVRHLGDDRLLDVDWSGIEFKIQSQPAPVSQGQQATSEK